MRCEAKLTKQPTADKTMQMRPTTMNIRCNVIFVPGISFWEAAQSLEPESGDTMSTCCTYRSMVLECKRGDLLSQQSRLRLE